jgi:hypothetical protein
LPVSTSEPMPGMPVVLGSPPRGIIRMLWWDINLHTALPGRVWSHRFTVPVPPAPRSFICEREIPTFAVFPYIGWHLRFFPGTGKAVPGVAIRHRIRELHIEYRGWFSRRKNLGRITFFTDTAKSVDSCWNSGWFLHRNKTWLLVRGEARRGLYRI